MRIPFLVLAVSAAQIATWGQTQYLTNEHCDIRVVYRPEADPTLEFSIRDSNRGFIYESEEVVLVARESSRLTLPVDLPPLGIAGSPLWVLPATQNPQLLYLGFSGDGIPQGVFEGPIEVRLTSVSGPGNFFIWQASGTGALEFQVDTTNGIDDQDMVAMFPAGHSHHNWGFTSNGVNKVTLQASGRRFGSATNDISLETTFVFHVEPLPEIPDSSFAQWQQFHWPGTTDPMVVGADADPDGDNLCNLLEYAFALDPNAADADADALPALAIQELDGETYACLTYRQSTTAMDIEFAPMVADDLTSPAWQPMSHWIQTVSHEGYSFQCVRDNVPLDLHAPRFFQLQVRLLQRLD